LDPSVKNLREWVGLLLALFCALDIAGVQYGAMIAQAAASTPNPVVGQIVAMTHGPRGAYFNIYITERQYIVFCALLGGAAISLFATLSLIVGHGVRRVIVARRTTASIEGKRSKRR